MSLDAEISSMMTQLRQMADGMTATATVYARGAPQYPQAFSPDSPRPYRTDVNRRQAGGFATYPPPPDVRADALDLPDPPALRAIPGTARRFVEPVPGVTFRPVRLQKPTFRRIDDPKAPSRIAPDQRAPDAPALDPLRLPRLNAPPQSWATRPLSGTFQEAEAPGDTGKPNADFDAEYRAGFAIAAPFLDPLRAIDGRIAAIEAEIARLSGPPDYEAYEREKYAQARSETDFQNRETVLQLDALPQNSAGLPDGRRVFPALDSRLKVHRADAAGALAARIGRLELELAYLQALRGLQAKTLSASLDLLSRAMELVLSGVDTALDSAEGALDTALQAMALERRNLAAFERFNATQKRVLEDRQKLALSQLERLDIAIEGMKLDARHDRNVLAAARVASGLIERKLALYRAQMDWVETDIQDRGLELEIYEAQLRLYTARARRKQAEINYREAEIKEDLNEMNAALTEIERHTLTIQQETANLSAQKVTVKAQAARNRMALERHKEARDAYLSQYRLVDEAARLHLRALESGKEAEFKSRELAVRRTELANQTALQEATREIQKQRVMVESSLRGQKLALSRLAQTGTIQNGVAGVLAGMASSAAGGLNTLVAATEKETL